MNGKISEGRVLVVDDDKMNVQIATDLITPMGFEVAAAFNGREALEKVLASPPDVILLDIMMPEMTGHEACARLKADPQTRNIPIIMLTALTSVEDHLEALKSGADDFMNKPFDRAIMEARLTRFLREKRLQEELADYRKHLEQRVLDQTRVIQRVQDVIMYTMTRLVEFRDPETGAHLERMRHYSMLMASKMTPHSSERGGQEDYARAIFRSSILHDIGKVGIKDDILLKPGKLTTEEFDVMKTHSTIGGDLLNEALKGLKKDRIEEQFVEMATEITYHHHEKYDGSGYPYGKKGDDIPLSARIVAVADVYDALTSKRPYKEPFSVDKALDIMRQGRGTHFDPKVLDCFMENVDEVKEIGKRYADDTSALPVV